MSDHFRDCQSHWGIDLPCDCPAKRLDALEFVLSPGYQNILKELDSLREEVRLLREVEEAARHLAADLDRRWTAGHPHRIGHLDPLLDALAAVAKMREGK